MSDPERFESGAPRGLAAAALAALFVAGFDAALAAFARDVPPAAALWLGLASLALTLAAALPIGLLATAALRPARLRRLLAPLARTPARRGATAALSLCGAAGLQWINATVYVRLYLTYHALLSLAALSLCTAGLALALPPGPRRPVEVTRRALAIALAALAGWSAALGGSLWVLTSRHRLRAFAIDRTALLSEELLALNSATGLLETPSLPAGGAGAARRLAARPPPPPRGAARGDNLVLLTIDSMRADRLERLPSLSALAEHSIRFTRAYAPACWTVHSMSAVLTSRFPSELRFTNVSVRPDFSFVRHPPGDPLFRDPLAWKKVTPVPIDEDAPTLPALLGGGGYQSGTVVSYIFYFRAAGVTRGFDAVDEDGYRGRAIDGAGVAPVPMVDRALALTADLDEPYFLWLHFMDAHAPYRARDEQARGAGPETRYDSELRFVDRQVGRLLDQLDARGTLDHTVIVVHADHGEEFGDHGGVFHAATLYEEIVHVPLLLRVPGRSPRVIDEPVSLLDLAPTLLDLAGVPATAPMRGRTLAPVLEGKKLPARPLIAQCDRFGRSKEAVIDGSLKLIVDRRVGTVELYDLSRDPTERHNLADARPADVRRLAALMPSAPAR